MKSKQVLKSGEKHKLEHPNPFITEEEEGEVASVGYRYRKWDLGNDIVSMKLNKRKQQKLTISLN